MEQKEALGITAKSNVFSQLLRQADIRMIGFDSKFEMDLDENSNIYLGSDTNLIGAQKAGIFGQTINFNVDAANSPIFAYLNTGLITAPIMMFMHHSGVAQDTILTFVNTPIIRRLSNDTKLSKSGKIIDLVGKDEKNKIKTLKPFDEIEKTIINNLKNLGFNELKNSEGKSFDIEDINDRDKETKERIDSIDDIMKDYLGEITPSKFNTKFLEDHIDRYNRYSTLSPKEKMIYNLESLQLLDQFVLLEKKAALIKMLQDGVSYDTKKALSPSQAYEMQENYDKVKELNQFINIERLRNNSVTTPFAIQEDMLDLISSILPLTNSREFIKFTADKLGDEGDLRSLDARLKDRFRREFPSGFIQYVFQTMQSPESVRALSMVTGIDLGEGTERVVNIVKEIGENPETLSYDYGVVQSNKNLSEEKTKEFIDLIAPQIEKQAYKENIGKNANSMFHFGKMWARLNLIADPLTILSFDKQTNNRNRLIKANQNAIGNTLKISEYTYAYHAKDQNGNDLPSLSQLAPIIKDIEERLGIDMKDYDSVIGNIYYDGQYVYPHKDTSESESARNYPVIVYTLGNDAGLGIVDNNEGKMTFANQYDDRYLQGNDKLKGYTNEVNTKNGSIYTFGMEGKGRFELTHSTPIKSNKTKSYPPIKLPNGKTITNYTITLTFRRAEDLQSDTPKTPKLKKSLLTKQEIRSTPKTLEANMTFLYEGNKRSDVTSNSTLEAIKNGERTATTRYESQGNISYFKSANVGDIIIFKGLEGNTAKVRVTKALHKLEGSGKTAEQWSKLEGWSVDYFKNEVKPKLKEAWQIEYEYIGNESPSTFQEGLKDFHKDFYKTLVLFKRNNPAMIEKYTLLSNLFINTSNINDTIKSIGLLFQGTDVSILNNYINQWRELMEEPGYIVSEDSNSLPIRQFMEQLGLFAFLQSGLGFSNIAFTRIIGSDTLADNITQTKQNLLNTIGTYGWESILNDYFIQFYNQNSSFRSSFYDYKTKTTPSSPKNNTTKTESHRLQSYEQRKLEVKTPSTTTTNSNNTNNNTPKSNKAIDSDWKYTFTYKGKTIKTEFQLSKDQTEALEKLIEFKTSEDSSIVLQGPAGTGKTSLIGYLQKYLDGENFLYTAPTHAATVELAFATMKTGNTSLPLTVASSLNTDRITKKTILSKKANEKLGFGNTIVVDETSMLNDKDYQNIKELMDSGYKIIFLGDKKQIPEVIKNKNLSKDISKAFTENETIDLDIIHRTSNNNIKNILQKMRDSIVFSLFKLKENTKNIQFFTSNLKFDTELSKYMLAEPEDTTYIAYTNKAVQSMNKRVREELFKRTGEVKKGDIIMGYLGYKSKQIDKGNLANSVPFTVQKVNKTNNGYDIEFSSERLNLLREQGFSEIPSVFSTTYLPLSSKESLESDFDNKVYEENNNYLSNLFSNLYILYTKALATKSGRDWSNYYNQQDSINRTMSFIDLGADYIYNINTNRFELYDKNNPSDEHKALKEMYKFGSKSSTTIFEVEKGIDYGHAITIHKSQGKSIKNVFFGANTIIEEDTILKEKGKQISTERQSLVYVGMSRASLNLFVNQGNLPFEEIDNLPEQETTKESDNKGFQGYKGGFDSKGKGTPEGDGKDKGMREIANGFIGEVVSRSSSSYTSAQTIGKKTKQGVTPEENSYTINAGYIEKNSIIMLARNGKFKGRPLEDSTKRDIADANMYGAVFIVGDMPDVDSQFIDYLQEINANFTIYHTGSQSRIKINNNTKTNGQLSLFNEEELGLNTDLKQDDFKC
jgi:hypothetical protein